MRLFLFTFSFQSKTTFLYLADNVHFRNFFRCHSKLGTQLQERFDLWGEAVFFLEIEERIFDERLACRLRLRHLFFTEIFEFFDEAFFVFLEGFFVGGVRDVRDGSEVGGGKAFLE